MIYGDFERVKREMTLARHAILAIDEFLEALRPGQSFTPDTQDFRKAYYKARGGIDEYKQFLEAGPGE